MFYGLQNYYKILTFLTKLCLSIDNLLVNSEVINKVVNIYKCLMHTS
jgi:hypothetical protein